MRLGVVLPFHTDAIAAAARAAEEAGFDSLWVVDAHNRGFMVPDPFVALAIAATVTERVEVGSAVVQVPLRAPFLLAQQVGSVAGAAGGRFVLGVGAGSTADDFRAVGADFSERFRVLDRHIEEVRTLLAGGDVDGNRLSPWRTMPSIPILVGAFGSSRWLRKAAADFDGWIASARSTDLTQMLDGLRRFRDLAGDKRAVAANLDATRSDAAEVLAALADAGFDDATVIVQHHDRKHLDQARRLWQN